MAEHTAIRPWCAVARYPGLEPFLRTVTLPAEARHDNHDLIILLRCYDQTLASAPIRSAAALRDWIAGIPSLTAQGATGPLTITMADLWIDLGDGLPRRVLTNGQSLGAVPITVTLGRFSTGEPNVTPSLAGGTWAAILATINDEISRPFPDSTAARPRYRNYREAQEDGWQVSTPTENYRGWLILPQYRGGRLRLEIRRHSGEVASGGRKFQRITPPKPPAHRLVLVDSGLTKMGRRPDGEYLVRTSDYLQTLDECRARVDHRVDGRRDLD